jgi:hypothetical protein
MIRQNGVSVDVDGKDLGQLGQLLDDPRLSVVEASLGHTIIAAEEGTAHTVRRGQIFISINSSNSPLRVCEEIGLAPRNPRQ